MSSDCTPHRVLQNPTFMFCRRCALAFPLSLFQPQTVYELVLGSAREAAGETAKQLATLMTTDRVAVYKLDWLHWSDASGPISSKS